MPVPHPDKPPAQFRPGPVRGKVTKLETYQKADGSWGMRPSKMGPGTTDAALIPRIEVTPIQRRVQSIHRLHGRMKD